MRLRGHGRQQAFLRKLGERQSLRARQAQRHLLESEDVVGPAVVALLAFGERGNVIGAAVRSEGDVASSRVDGRRFVRVPLVGRVHPDRGRAAVDLLEHPGLDPLAAEAELFPDLRPDGEGPLVRVARVDLRSGRKLDPAHLLGVVGPQRDRRLIEANSRRQGLGRDVRVEPRASQRRGRHGPVGARAARVALVRGLRGVAASVADVGGARRVARVEGRVSRAVGRVGDLTGRIGRGRGGGPVSAGRGPHHEEHDCSRDRLPSPSGASHDGVSSAEGLQPPSAHMLALKSSKQPTCSCGTSERRYARMPFCPSGVLMSRQVWALCQKQYGMMASL